MKTIFISQDLWGAIEEAFQEATPKEQSTWVAGRLKEYKQSMQKDAKALSLIQQGEGESIQAFFSRVSNIVSQIRSNMDMIEDKKILQKILRSLPANLIMWWLLLKKPRT
ncbi:copia-type polyprotein [Senna tora]|uniref:Copia-type polyprotein n=1 Tax=Senna tora TaxID=362788 RepID=A0A834XDI9_9FABA|nr:copia-type polyprotein [Senna tora]